MGTNSRKKNHKSIKMIKEANLLELLKFYSQFNIFVNICSLLITRVIFHKRDVILRKKFINVISNQIWRQSRVLHLHEDWLECYFPSSDIFFPCSRMLFINSFTFHRWRCWAPSTPKYFNRNKSNSKIAGSWVLQIPSETSEITFSCRYNLYIY